jgi:subtilase family serine protease
LDRCNFEGVTIAMRPLALVLACALLAAGCSGSNSGGGGMIPDQPDAGAPMAEAPQPDQTETAAAQASMEQTPGEQTLPAGAAGGQPAPAASVSQVPRTRELCPQRTGEVRCLALVRTDAGAPATGYHGTDMKKAFGRDRVCDRTAPYCPADLQAAYGVAKAARTRGSRQLVAIVDAYGYREAERDLGVYRATMGLPPCTSRNGCLRIVNQRGQASPLPGPSLGWEGEQALDVDMVSAMCPKCRILLVQADTGRIRDIDAAVGAAIALGAGVVSNSYGGPEWSADDRAFDRPGHVLVAGAGDRGAAAQQPCSFAHVVCAGGTSLTTASTTRGWAEVTWDNAKELGTGSGCSARVAKPSWQRDTGCGQRSETDLSADADPLTGVAVYQSSGGGWRTYGGTSVSSPVIAAMFALAGNAAKIAAPQWVWQHGNAGFNDVVSGNNPGSFHCTDAMRYICNAGPGYDGPTGWGTPNGLEGL